MKGGKMATSVLLTILAATIVSGSSYETYHMDAITNLRTIKLREPNLAIIVKGSEHESYRPVKKTTALTVIAQPGYDMLVSVAYFNIPKIRGKCQDHIEFEGLAEPGDDVEMCGSQNEIAKVFHTSEKRGPKILKITFQTVTRPQDFDEKANFEFVITAVKKSGNCRATEFHECSNKYCIPIIYKCDKHDNCGDNSDENKDKCPAELNSKKPKDPGLSTFSLIIIIFSSFVGLILLAAITIYKCRNRPSTLPGELSRISTVEGQLHASNSYNAAQIPNDPRRPASTSPVNPPYSPYYQNEGYQPYQGTAPDPDEDAAPPPYEEAITIKS